MKIHNNPIAKGTIMWWGYSSALDILNECDLHRQSNNLDNGTSTSEDDRITLNVLLVGQSDNRHVLKTLAKRYEHEEKVKMNLFVCEALIENIARDLLFSLLALEVPERVGLAEKTQFFMELYGNTLIRPATSNYLSTAAQQLLKMITDKEYSKELMPALSLEKLKYSEIDQLEVIFKYWSTKDNSFDILHLWDQRIRKSLDQRYDAMYGVFDWDYHMRYCSFGAETLNIQEYKRFREKGMAFYSEDTDPCISNQTLASGIISAGLKIKNFGYHGDIVTGPYPAFGFDSEDQQMLEKANGRCKKTATDVTENNVMRLMYEIVNQEPFLITYSRDESCCYISQDTSHRLQIKSLPEDGETIYKKTLPDYRLLPVHDCQIILLTMTTLNKLLKNPAYENFFDIVTFPQVMVLKYFSADIVKLMKPNSKLIVDTPKYLLAYRKDDLTKYKADVENLMKEFNCKSQNSSFSYKSDEFMKFQVLK